MRAERFVAADPQRPAIGSGTLILAAIGCFAIGFVALMAVPRFFPRYVQTATAPDAAAVKTPEVSALPAPLPSPVPAVAPSGVVTTIKPSGAPVPQKVVAFGALATLAECKAAIRAGQTFDGVSADQIAATFGTRAKSLTTTQLDAACRKLTE